MTANQSTRNSRIINAPIGKVYAALTNPEAIPVFMAPDEMTGKMHQFDFREGGTYEMSLYYPEGDFDKSGKSGGNEDRFKARIDTIVPNEKLVFSIDFDSDDENFNGTMKMEIQLMQQGEKTEVIFLFSDIPKGIDPKDNEAGTESTLDKLERYLAEH